jgi:nitronate monooxygenase
VAEETAAIEKQKGTAIQFGDIAHLVAGSRGREAEKAGDKDGGIWSAGSAVGLVDDIPTVQQFMDRFMAEAVATITNRLAPMVQRSKL